MPQNQEHHESKANRTLARLANRLVVAVITSLLIACNQPLQSVPLPQTAFDESTVILLQQTHAANIESILRQNSLLGSGRTDFVSANPYFPLQWLPWDECWNDSNCQYSITQTGIPVQAFPAREEVVHWWQNKSADPVDASVCGVRFIDSNREEYELASFYNRHTLEASPGFQLTHYQQCGACSTLQDLAVYGSLDLTVMAKVCSKRMGLANKKSCMMEIGFSETCAESWAYNADKTSQSCLLVCINEYGLIPLLTGTESSPNAEAGQLNQCLLCDEMISGPGFQYSAGRTRRNSGIVSEIDRPDEQVYDVNHTYFD